MIEMRRKHPKWGRQGIADELAKANGWKPLVSANTVKRILKDAGLWETIEADVKKNPGRGEAAPQQSRNRPQTLTCALFPPPTKT